MVGFLKIVRAVLITIDRVVYWFAGLVYELFVMIAETGIFRSSDMRAFSNRIYFFLGLIMLFKVSISIVQYIMNPDAVKDNKNGAGKLLKNLVFVLLGIVLIPYVFEMAFGLQRIVLNDNIIGNLILGKSAGEGTDVETAVQNGGRSMSFSIYTAFFNMDTDLGISEECSNNPVIDGRWNEACDTSKMGDFADTVGPNFIQAYNEENLKYLLNNSDIYNATVGDEFLFSYSYVIVFVAGCALVYILLIFCIDTATRAVKLAFLQLIAPIPLIAKIDPNKGDKVFGDWVKECVNTYISVFIRLAALYFVVYILTVIKLGLFNVVDNSAVTNPFVYVAIIFGALLFAKDLPKLIEKLTGIKLDGDGLKLGKKLTSAPILGTALGNTARKVAGGLDAKAHGAKFGSGWKIAKEKDKGMLADMRKKRMEYLPYSGEKQKKDLENAKKNIQGAVEANKMDKKWKKGQDAHRNLNELGERVDEKGNRIKGFDLLNGEDKNSDAYRRVFANEEFVKSKMSLDKEDDKLKHMNATISGLRQAAANGEITKEELIEAEESLAKQQKKVDGLKNVHEVMRNKYAEDADMEDSIKFAKYNNDNPVTGESPDLRSSQERRYDAAYDFASGIRNIPNSVEAFAGSIKSSFDNISFEGMKDSIKSGVESAFGGIRDNINTSIAGLHDGIHNTRVDATLSASNMQAPTSTPTPTPSGEVRYETVQQGVDRVAGVHDAPTQEEHNQRYEELSGAFANMEPDVTEMASAIANAVSSGMQQSAEQMGRTIASQVGNQVSQSLSNGISLDRTSMRDLGRTIADNINNPNAGHDRSDVIQNQDDNSASD